jgi:hypothetical protein
MQPVSRSNTTQLITLKRRADGGRDILEILRIKTLNIIIITGITNVKTGKAKIKAI